MSLHTQTVAELAAGLAARRYSSLELTLHFLGRIERLGPELNAFVTVTAERALDDARRADRPQSRHCPPPGARASGRRRPNVPWP